MIRIDPVTWQSLSPLLDELLDADAERTHERLEQIRRSDPALAAQLEALLSHRALVHAEHFLEESVADQLGASLEGRVVGDYQIERPIGQGGMGSVWLARRSDGRYEGRAAIKFLSLAMLGPDGIERFRREGSALAKLAHPNVTHLIDAGMADGQPYLVLEYIEGERIDRWCDTHMAGIPARIRLFLQVLSAISHAHSRLILHRDLKPSNILVTADGQAKLLDFGLAKLLTDSDASELTRIGGHAFTPEYAAPEQAQQREATTATDVYALGVLLYVLFVGQHPTAGAAATPLERMRALIEREPMRLSDAALATDTAVAQMRGLSPMQLRRELRGDLENIVAKALKKDPAERYVTVDAFASDLGRYLRDEPISARADSRAYVFDKFVRRHRLAVGAFTISLIALIGGVAGTLWQAREAQRERDQALFQSELALARGNVMEVAVQAAAAAERPITQLELLDRSVNLVEKRYSNQPRVAVEILYAIAGQYAGLGHNERDIAVMSLAARIAAASADPQLIGHVACNTVAAELDGGRVDLARQQLDKGLAALAQLPAPTMLSRVECTRAQAEVAEAIGDLSGAVERVHAAIGILERNDGMGGSQFTTLLGLLAALYERQGDLSAAFEAHGRAGRVHESLGRTDMTNYLAVRVGEARILASWGEYQRARDLMDEVAPRVRGAAGDGTPPAWLVWTQGLVRWRLGDLSGAEEILRVARQLRARGSVVYARQSEVMLAHVLIDMQRHQEAETLLKELEATTEPWVEKSIQLTTLRAHFLLAQSRPREAAQALAPVLEQADEKVRKTAIFLTALRLATRSKLAAGDARDALRLAQETVSVSIAKARDPSQSGDVGEARLLLAQAHHLAGRRRESIEAARLAREALTKGFGRDHRLTREASRLAAA